MIQQVTSPSSPVLWIEADDGIPEEFIPTGPVPSPVGSPSKEPLEKHGEKVAHELRQLLSEEGSEELKEILREIDKTKKLLREVDHLSFKLGKANETKGKQGEKGHVLYNKKQVFALCRLIHEGIDGLSPQSRKCIKSTPNFVLKFATKEQRTELLRSLNGDLALEPIREAAQRYYLPVDQSELRFCSSGVVLAHVLNRAEEELNRNLGDPTMEKVRDYAQKLFALLPSEKYVPTNLLFHMTPKLEDLLGILEKGIQVRHEKKYAGAYVSTRPEVGYGLFGVMVCPHSLAAKRSVVNLQRRSNQEEGSVWLGSNQPISPLKKGVLVSKEVTPNRRRQLRERLDEKGFRDVEILDPKVMELFCKLAREVSYFVPVPERTSPRRLAAWNEPNSP